ncbi:hypothetical protein D3C75_1164510 [compost metagenome]
MMYMVHEINNQFEDDLGNQISVQGSVKDQVMNFTVQTNTSEPIYWIVREIGQVERVIVNGRERVHAEYSESQDTNSYNVRERDLILSFSPGENHVQIMLNAGGNNHVN